MSGKNKNNILLFKILIIGDSGVGKTNILTRFTEGIFKNSYVATIGVDFKMKVAEIEGKQVKLQIWDTAGQERFRNITQTYYKGASGIMLVFSINQAESFRNIHSWIKQIDMNTSDSVAKIMIGSKCDLENERQVSKEEAENLAIKHGMEYIEVSSKEGINIDTSFEKLATVIKKQKQNLDQPMQDPSVRLGARSQQQKTCSC